MRRTLLVLVVGLAVAAFAVAACGGDDEGEATDTETTTETTDTGTGDGTTLAGNVGPGFEISLTMANGDEIAALKAGTYSIEVNDQSDIHDFHLTGPGVDESTSVPETGETTWTVDLQEGTYSYVCDPHVSSMSGSFEVSG